MVCYKSFADDPEADGAAKTVQFRQLDPPNDERALLGVQYDRGLTKPRNLFDFEVDRDSLDDPWMKDTGFVEDDRPVVGVVGYEWDGVWRGEAPPRMKRFLHFDHELGPADCIRWEAPSGARIFASGSLALSLALDDWTRGKLADERVQRLLRNAIDDLSGKVRPPAAG